MKNRTFKFVMACGLLCALSSLSPAAGLFDGADGGASGGKLTPGHEVQVRNPDLGGKGYYTVYLPTDYDGKRSFPVIFSYHGQFQDPTSSPFKQITGGKGFITVGMEYHSAAPAGPVAKQRLSSKSPDPRMPEVDALRRVAASLRNDLKIESGEMFIGGFASGAIEAQVIAARSPELWAGVIVLGAGDAKEPGMAPALAHKPILIAVGEKDTDYDAARSAAEMYRKIGAEVTFETFAGAAHEVVTSDPVLKKWLIDNGPHRQVHNALTFAQAAEKSGRLGAALTAYESVAKMDAPAEEAKAARDAAKTLRDQATAALATAEQALNSNDNAKAARALIQVRQQFDGSEFGAKAADRLKTLQSDPAVAKALAQLKLDEEADVLETQGTLAEQAQNFQKAVAAYEQYLSRYPTAHHAEAVRARLAALQSNKTIAAKQAESDCRSWLSLADNFIQSGLPDKARPYLQRIIDTYGATPWADQARERMKKLDGG